MAFIFSAFVAVFANYDTLTRKIVTMDKKKEVHTHSPLRGNLKKKGKLLLKLMDI